MYSDEEKKAIDYLQFCYDIYTIDNESLSKLGIALNLIEKQNKMINEMADRLEFVMKNSNIGLDPEHGVNFTIDDILKYFEEKVRENK